MTSLEGWSSAIELHPRSVMILNAEAFGCIHGVGATGLEPAIFCSQSRRASHYATPRPSGPVRTFATSVGHATAPTNPVGRTCPYGGLAGLRLPRRIAAAQREPSWGGPCPSVLRSQEYQRAKHRRAVEPYPGQDHR